VLWHQGESDAGQAGTGHPADRQISGQQYEASMEKLSQAARKKAKWEVPWYVAQATYHCEEDPADEEFRGARKRLYQAMVTPAKLKAAAQVPPPGCSPKFSPKFISTIKKGPENRASQYPLGWSQLRF
jgi:hypothetical protein